MARVSMADVWDDTRAFVIREGALLVPLALATIGLSLLLLAVVMPETTADATPAPGPWMLGLIPPLLLMMIGNVAISAIVVMPRLSVAEALATGFRRLPAAIAIVLLIAVAATLAMALLLVVMQATGVTDARIPRLIATPISLWLTVRLLPLPAVLVDAPSNIDPIGPLRRTIALTRGHALPILGVVLLYSVALLIVWAAMQFSLGTALGLAGRAMGDAKLGSVIATALVSLAIAIVQAVWIAYAARLYRRLADSKGI